MRNGKTGERDKDRQSSNHRNKCPIERYVPVGSFRVNCEPYIKSKK